jgi:hypothetical protein
MIELKQFYITKNQYSEDLGIYINLSYKNIYNFSKSLYYIKVNSEDNKNFKDLLIDTNTLYYNDKSIKLRNEINDYFNIHIKNNIHTLSNYDRNNKFDDITKKMNIYPNTLLKYPKFSKKQCDIYILLLYSLIIDVKHYIVMECLIKRGILTKYIIRDEKFEKKPLKEIKTNQEIFHTHLKQYEDAYYYLNDKKYKDLQNFYNPQTKKLETYFERLKSGALDWYNFYAMDWVSQINFYHHFINNRVNFLTGGTGVGKSTQTPKLLLYGLKAYDKIFNAKIICTQPRIAPTVDNAKRISSELGVDIEAYSIEHNSMVKTTNGIIQYKYEKDDHIDDDQNFFLRIVTNG